MSIRRLLIAICLGLGCLRCPGYEEITAEWSRDMGSYTASSPALADDGTVYFGADDGRFWALNSNGSVRWVLRAGGEIRSSPALAKDGTAYFGCRDRKIYAVSSEGKKKWEFKTGAWVDSSPALGEDGTVYFGSWDKTFYALRPDGSLRWKFVSPGEIVSSPSIDRGGTIYFGCHDARCYALRPDGSRAWEFVTGGPVISSPALGQSNSLYFSSVDGWFYALDTAGRLRWRLRTGGITGSSPVIGLEGMIYVGVNERVWAITPDGTKKWDQTVPAWRDFFFDASPVALADGAVCHVSRYGMLMDIQQPELLWQYYLRYGEASPAVGPEGAIYAFKFPTLEKLRTRVPLARSPWPKFRGNARNTGNAADVPGQG